MKLILAAIFVLLTDLHAGDIPLAEQRLESSLKLDKPAPAADSKLPPGVRTRGISAPSNPPPQTIERRGFRLRGGELPESTYPLTVTPGASSPAAPSAPSPVVLTEQAAKKAELEPVTTSVVADSEALLEDVRFVFNSTEFAHPASAFQSLQQVAHVLERHPEARLLIEGHTCDLGEERFNLVLSCKRADSVAAYLIGLGIDSHRLITTGFGEADPIVSVQNADGAAQAEAKRTVNRRARLRLAAPTGQR